MKKKRTAEGYDLIRSQAVETPFSFGKTIFLPTSLDYQSEEMIIRHEKAHIAHRHYLEVWLIECVARLCWFNPIVWLCRSELRNIHEYEADSDVIGHGTDIHAYQSTLLEMVMNENCPAVNGFNHSFIRQRFIEMKSSSAGTLGKMGKISLMAAVVVLFASFTLRSVPSATQQKWKNPKWPQPMLFTIDGILADELTETQLNLYMADETFHIEEDTPRAIIPIVDHKFHYEILLDSVTGGRLRGIGQNGQKTELCLEQFFVPGGKFKVEINERLFASWDRNGYYYTNSYGKAVVRAIKATQCNTDMQSPHYPKMEREGWQQVKFDKNILYRDIKSVYFDEDKTILYQMPNMGEYRYLDFPLFSSIDKDYFLEDANGNRYKCIGQYPENDNQYGIEAAVFGSYKYFEKMPQDTKHFDIGHRRTDGNIDSLYNKLKDLGYKAKKEDGSVVLYEPFDIIPQKQKKQKKQKPNFRITITATPGIPDCGYIIELEGENAIWESELVADLPVDENRQCSFTTYLDDIRIGEVTAIFPDGSVCLLPVRLPFVPGEDVDLRIYHANHQVSGSKTNFYKEWTDAKVFAENINNRGNLTFDDRDELEIEYQNKNNDKLGSLYYFKLNARADVSFALDSLPPSILDTKFGKEWVGRADSRAEYKAKKLRTKDNPLYIFLSPERDNSFWPKVELDKLDSLLIQGGAYVLKEEYKGTEDPLPYGYYKNAQNGVKVYKTIQEKKDSIQKVYYRTR